MRLQVRCNNNECPEFNEVRTASYLSMPGGFFMKGAILCACGQEVQVMNTETRAQGWV